MSGEINFTRIQESVLQELGSDPKYTGLLRRADTLEQSAVDELIGVICNIVTRIVDIGNVDTETVALKIYRSNYGLGAITELYADPEVSEIWVNAYDDIWVERNGLRSKCKGLSFQSPADVRRVIDLMNRYDKKEISATNPKVESKLADGSRLTSVIPPVVDSPMFTLRCPNSFVPTTENLLAAGTLDQGVVDLLTVLVRGRANILVIGETGAGKTQFIRWLLGRVRRDLHVVTIETRQELFLKKLYSDLSVDSLEECPEHGIGHSELFRLSLRMTPNIIVCGEMRSYEAEWVINAMRRGHPGSMSSLHTTSPEFVVDDIAEMICDDGKPRDPKQLTQRIANAVDIVIQITRSDATGKRSISRVTELVKDDSTRYSDIPYTLNDLCIHDEASGSFIKTGQIRTAALKQKLLRYALTGNDAISAEKLQSYLYSF